jgi:hypothetical protein
VTTSRRGSPVLVQNLPCSNSSPAQHNASTWLAVLPPQPPARRGSAATEHLAERVDVVRLTFQRGHSRTQHGPRHMRHAARRKALRRVSMDWLASQLSGA